MAQVAITRRALLQRINRKLVKEGEVLRAARSERSRQSVGDFYLVDLSKNAVLDKDVDPVEKGRELGVLAGYEKVVDADGMRHCAALTIPKSVPAGRVLVHNHIRHAPDTPVGTNGFRAWTQNLTSDLVECTCGWAARVPGHYRVGRTSPKVVDA
jgi:hypothetical protein